VGMGFESGQQARTGFGQIWKQVLYCFTWRPMQRLPREQLPLNFYNFSRLSNSIQVSFVQTGCLLVRKPRQISLLVAVIRIGHATNTWLAHLYVPYCAATNLGLRMSSCTGQGLGNVFSIINTIALKAVWDSWMITRTSVVDDEKRRLHCKNSLRGKRVIDTFGKPEAENLFQNLLAEIISIFFVRCKVY